MNRGHFILHEKEYNAFQSVLKKLLADSYAKVVFLVDKNGSLLSSMGETADFDTTSLASLAAGNIAATGGACLSDRGEGILRPLPRGRAGQHAHIGGR